MTDYFDTVIDTYRRQKNPYTVQVLEIYPDKYYEDPREWGGWSKMICFHSRYNLDDKHDYKTPSDFKEHIECLEEDGEEIYMLPLYLYDHSGITMNTTGFRCIWDSGQVGYIYTTDELMRDEGFGTPEFPIPDREKILSWLDGLVQTYDAYLRGEVYRFRSYEVITINPNGDTKEINEDSCSGFGYGEDWDMMVFNMLEHCFGSFEDLEEWKRG